MDKPILKVNYSLEGDLLYPEVRDKLNKMNYPDYSLNAKNEVNSEWGFIFRETVNDKRIMGLLKTFDEKIWFYDDDLENNLVSGIKYKSEIENYLGFFINKKGFFLKNEYDQNIHSLTPNLLQWNNSIEFFYKDSFAGKISLGNLIINWDLKHYSDCLSKSINHIITKKEKELESYKKKNSNVFTSVKKRESKIAELSEVLTVK
jgi:hypothetical protein